MERENRIKMKREDRAKQFMPFKALKGYDEALRKKEEVKVSKKEFSREYEEVLDYKLREIKKNDIIKVIYYFKGACIEKTGKVSKIDNVSRCLYVTNDKILFDNIYDIDVIKEK